MIAKNVIEKTYSTTVSLMESIINKKAINKIIKEIRPIEQSSIIV